jgi:DNA-binding transcriptional regulator GbsR (MarR family)
MQRKYIKMNYPANFKEYFANKVIDYLDNDLDYHYKRIAMIKKEKEEARKLAEAKYLNEIREKYPKIYVLVEYTSGYRDWESNIACFTNREIALKYMGENYRSGKSSSRFNEDYYIREMTSTSVPNTLLLELDNPKKKF